MRLGTPVPLGGHGNRRRKPNDNGKHAETNSFRGRAALDAPAGVQRYLRDARFSKQPLSAGENPSGLLRLHPGFSCSRSGVMMRVLYAEDDPEVADMVRLHFAQQRIPAALDLVDSGRRCLAAMEKS